MLAPPRNFQGASVALPAGLLFGALAWGGAGDLDASFGADGRVFVDVANDTDIAATVIQQADGSVVVGRGNDAVHDDFSVLRFEDDGSPDLTFGRDGRTVFDFPGVKGVTRVVLQQADGKIVAAGTTRNTADSAGTNFGLVRYDQDGSVDTTFGSDGIVIHDLGGWDDRISSIVQQADGRLVAGGTTDGGVSSTADMAFVRLNVDGTLDRSFGANGVVIINFHDSNGYDEVHWLVQQPDGKLIGAGDATRSNPYTNQDMAVVRLLPDGELDATFGDGGRAIAELHDPSGQGAGSLAGALSLGLQSDGGIVLAGYSNFNVWDYGACAPVLARLTVAGDMDTTFGTDGTAWFDFDCADFQGLVIGADDTIYVTGALWDAGRSDHFVARMVPNGKLDQSFGVDGVAIIDAGGGDAVMGGGHASLIRTLDGGTVTVSSAAGEDAEFDQRLVVARLLAGGVFAGLLGLKGPVSVLENEVAMIAVRRSGGSTGTVSVDYSTNGGTATSGVDFTPSAGTLTWLDGDRADKTIEVSIAADTHVEGPEAFLVTLSNPSGGARLGASQLEVQIAGQAAPASPPPVPPATPGGGGGGAIEWLTVLFGLLLRLQAATRVARNR